MNDAVEQARRELAARLSAVTPDSAKIAQAAKPGYRFAPEACEDAVIPVGASKVGGKPDLPPNFVWPSWQRRQRELVIPPPGTKRTPWRECPVAQDEKSTSLDFVAQINLADLSPDLLGLDLPKQGVLSFFYDTDRQPWGFDPIDGGAARMFWFDEIGLVRASVLPEGHQRFVASRLKPRLSMTIPEEMIHAAGRGNKAFYAELEKDGSEGLLVGGYPDVIQNGGMEMECEAASNGYYMGDHEGYLEAEQAGIGPGAAQWRLALQIASMDDLGIMWGDSGNLYVWARADDIAQRRFEKAWTVLQCF